MIVQDRSVRGSVWVQDQEKERQCTSIAPPSAGCFRSRGPSACRRRSTQRPWPAASAACAACHPGNTPNTACPTCGSVVSPVSLFMIRAAQNCMHYAYWYLDHITELLLNTGLHVAYSGPEGSSLIGAVQQRSTEWLASNEQFEKEMILRKGRRTSREY